MRPLTTKQALALLKRGETETVEFKKAFDRETIETLSAFANTHGGFVFIGVSDTGEVVGAEVGRETIQNWINQVKLSTANALLPDVELVRVKKKDVAVLSITEYPIKPVACRGRYFKREQERQSPNDRIGCGQRAFEDFQHQLGLLCR